MINITDAIAKDRFLHNEDVKTCIHEAAHTVAAVIFGLPIHWVSLDRDFIRHDEIAVKHGCATGDPMAMITSSDIIWPIIERGYTRTIAEKEIVRNYCTMCLAGPVAEERMDPKGFDARGSTRDYAQVDELLKGLLKGFELKRAQKRAFSDAVAFCFKYQHEIVEVANTLQKRRTLFRADIEQIINGAQRREAA